MKDNRSLLDKVRTNLGRPSKLRRYLTSSLFFESPGSPKILLVGSGRSGTTWLSELINYDNRLRFVFEPLQAEWGIKYQGLKPWLYCESQSIPHQLAADISHLFFGFYRGHGMDTWNAKRLVLYHGRLVKSIRMHGVLSVVHTIFPDIKIIYLIRHPCAVLNSYYQHSWEFELPKLIANMSGKCHLVDDNLQKLHSLSTALQKFIYLWSIENRIALDQLRNIPHFMCYYETLVNNPSQTIQSLFTFLDRPMTGLSPHHIARPSSHAGYRKDDPLIASAALERWKQSLPLDDIHQCLEIVQEFGLDNLYSDCPTPNPEFRL